MPKKRTRRRIKRTKVKRTKVRVKRTSGKRDIIRDLKRPALPKGKRVSKSGKVYREYRDNRTDSHGKTSRDKKLSPKYYPKYKDKGWL